MPYPPTADQIYAAELVALQPQFLSLLQANSAPSLTSFDFVRSHPLLAQSIADTISIIMNDAEVKSIALEETHWSDDPIPLPEYFSYVLTDELGNNVEGDSGHFVTSAEYNVVSHSSPIISSALFTAAAFHAGLVDNAGARALFRGLKIDTYLEWSDKDKKKAGPRGEVWAIAACLLLAVGGSKMVHNSKFYTPKEKVLRGLEGLETDECMRNSNGSDGRALLGKALENARSDYTRDISVEEAWKTFPEDQAD